VRRAVVGTVGRARAAPVGLAQRMWRRLRWDGRS